MKDTSRCKHNAHKLPVMEAWRIEQYRQIFVKRSYLAENISCGTQYFLSLVKRNAFQRHDDFIWGI